MEPNMASTASYPPLQKSQGRGTLCRGGTCKIKKGGPPASISQHLSILRLYRCLFPPTSGRWMDRSSNRVSEFPVHPSGLPVPTAHSP